MLQILGVVGSVAESQIVDAVFRLMLNFQNSGVTWQIDSNTRLSG